MRYIFIFLLVVLGTQLLSDPNAMCNVTSKYEFYSEYDYNTKLVVRASIINLLYSEGFSTDPYYCQAGKKTIGFGSHAGSSSISLEQAFIKVQKSLVAIYKSLDKKYPKLSHEEKVSLLSFFYNVTIRKTSTMHRYLGEGKMDSVRYLLPSYNQVYDKEKKKYFTSSGLTNRRKREVFIMKHLDNQDSLIYFSDSLYLKLVEEITN